MNLGAYTNRFADAYPEFPLQLSQLPMVIVGDFNADIKKPENKEFIEFMKD